MIHEYHILNGDSLNKQLEDINGHRIIFRESLIEGNVQGSDYTEFFNNRAAFYRESYDVTHQEYDEISKSEILKLGTIPDDAEVNLWFEFDLFCQTNMWFCVALLQNIQSLYFVTPIEDSWHGFGALSKEQLLESYESRIRLNTSTRETLVLLWNAYQVSDFNSMKMYANKLSETIDHIQDVVKAHIDRFPKNDAPGRPQQRLLDIMDQLDAPSFGDIFKAFCRTEGIYGFGDLQVRRMMNDLQTT